MPVAPTAGDGARLEMTMKLDLSADPPSDAAALLTDLAARGIGPDAIAAEHAAPAYARLRRVAQPPDFDVARAALPDAPPPRRVEGLTAVIVETRAHENLPFVVGQAHERLGAPIQLYHGPDNRDFIQGSSIAALAARGAVTLTPLSCARFNATIYNALFLMPEFWDSMIGRGKVLVFQTDAVLCARTRHPLQDFLGFDYIGAAWERDRPVGLRIDGGVGGLSLRDWARSAAALRRFPPDAWVGGEDGYFGFHIELMGGRVGAPRDCVRFCTQFTFRARSFGVHKPSRLSRIEWFLLTRYCPEVRRIA